MYLSVSFTSKQNLSEERLNSQKLIWFYLLEKKISLSAIILISNFVASNYHQYMTYFRFFPVLYCFAPFLKFGPLSSENSRCTTVSEDVKLIHIKFYRYFQCIKTKFSLSSYTIIFILLCFFNHVLYAAFTIHMQVLYSEIKN